MKTYFAGIVVPHVALENSCFNKALENIGVIPKLRLRLLRREIKLRNIARIMNGKLFFEFEWHMEELFINSVVKSYLKTNQYFCETLWDLWNVASPEAKQFPICSAGFRNKNLVKKSMFWHFIFSVKFCDFISGMTWNRYRLHYLDGVSGYTVLMKFFRKLFLQFTQHFQSIMLLWQDSIC